MREGEAKSASGEPGCEAAFAWAAGVFEGEGCLSWMRKGGERPYPTASLGMTDEDVVRRFAEIIGIGKVTTPARRPDRKQQWQWRGFGAAAMAHLDQTIGPWLGIRRRAKLDEMLTFEPRREGERGRWIGDRWFADPARMRLSTGDIQAMLLAGESISAIIRKGTSHRRIVRIRDDLPRVA